VVQAAAMAETLTVSTTLTYRNATGSKTLGGTTTTEDAGVHFCQETQAVGTSAELLDVGTDVTAAGLQKVIIRNLDANNFITVYSDNGTTSIGIVEAGESHIFTPAGDYVPYVKADTAAVNIEFLGVSVPPA
jgi:hypothetical protein